MKYPIKFIERIKTKILIEPYSGCWLWTAGTRTWGYAQTSLKNKTYSAHKVLYEDKFGKVPDGLELDHLCKVKCCVNPSHLEAVTHTENVRRGRALEAIRRERLSRTHCKWGHEFTTENTLSKTNGARGCRICTNIRQREAYYKNKKDLDQLENEAIAV